MLYNNVKKSSSAANTKYNVECRMLIRMTEQKKTKNHRKIIGRFFYQLSICGKFTVFYFYYYFSEFRGTNWVFYDR